MFFSIQLMASEIDSTEFNCLIYGFAGNVDGQGLCVPKDIDRVSSLNQQCPVDKNNFCAPEIFGAGLCVASTSILNSTSECLKSINKTSAAIVEEIFSNPKAFNDYDNFYQGIQIACDEDVFPALYPDLPLDPSCVQLKDWIFSDLQPLVETRLSSTEDMANEDSFDDLMALADEIVADNETNTDQTVGEQLDEISWPNDSDRDVNDSEKTELEINRSPSNLCIEEDFHARITELMAKDDDNILGKSFMLVEKKLALKALRSQAKEPNIKTLEEMVNREVSSLAIEDKQGIRKELASLSQVFPMPDQALWVDELLSGQQSIRLNYFKRESRLNNFQIAELLMVEMLKNPDQELFDLADLGITLLFGLIGEQASKEFGAGTAEANLYQLSNRVARLTGVIQELPAQNVEKLTDELNNLESQVDEHYMQMAGQLIQEFPSCIKEMGISSECSVFANILRQNFGYFLGDVGAQMPQLILGPDWRGKIILENNKIQSGFDIH